MLGLKVSKVLSATTIGDLTGGIKCWRLRVYQTLWKGLLTFYSILLTFNLQFSQHGNVYFSSTELIKHIRLKAGL